MEPCCATSIVKSNSFIFLGSVKNDQVSLGSLDLMENYVAAIPEKMYITHTCTHDAITTSANTINNISALVKSMGFVAAVLFSR